MYVIEVDNLYKSYSQVAVLRGLSLRVRTGEVYGLLGPNGAGKSTLLLTLLGFLRAERGSVRLLGGDDLETARRRVGYLPERLSYHTRYTAREYLRFLGQFSDLHGTELRDRVARELHSVGLTGLEQRRLDTFSKGMLQRIGIAQALLADPELLLIDEPTSGLDPAGQQEMRDLLRDLKARGHSILMCSHQLEEVEQLCDRVGILYHGRLVTELTAEQIHTPGQGVSMRVPPLSDEQAARLLSIAPTISYRDGALHIQPNSPEVQARVLRALLDQNIMLLGLQPQDRPLERVYLQVVRGTLEALPPPSRPGEGDTLLRELLRRERAE
jgi:ABC-2 type transport system ATP-binding protein